MGVNVAINGFGRIGRCISRIILSENKLNLVAINCSWDMKSIKYLLKYDSVHGNFNQEIDNDGEDVLIVGNKRIQIIRSREIENIDFAKYGASLVFECTGAFLTQEKTKAYLDNGIKKVIMSAPPKDNTPMFVMDVNHNNYKGEAIISNASCTTNCLAPMAKVLDENFGIKKALMNTIHAYTATQELCDTKCPKDIRRGRAAALNLVPSSTGAAKSIGKVIPNLLGKVDGQSVRTSLANVSMLDLTLLLDKKTSKEEINETFIKASKNMSEILAIDYDCCVSSDFCTSTYGCVFVPDLTQIIDEDFVKVLAWYDNEYGYSYQLNRLAQHISKEL